MQRVVGLDEGRFGLKTWLRRRWCPRGVRPPWVVEDRYEWVWLYAAVEPTTGQGVFLFLPTMADDCLALFLQKVRRAFGKERVGVVLDNASSHRSQQIPWPEGLVSLPLPAYSPELNPAEPIFRSLRQPLANRIFATLEAIEDALTQELRRFWEDPPVLQRLTAYPWWVDGIVSSPS